MNVNEIALWKANMSLVVGGLQEVVNDSFDFDNKVSNDTRGIIKRWVRTKSTAELRCFLTFLNGSENVNTVQVRASHRPGHIGLQAGSGKIDLSDGLKKSDITSLFDLFCVKP